MPILRAQQLEKSFLFQGEISKVLKGINLELQEGEFVSIVGASGCGKTTLLEILAGITFSDNGSIYYMDRDITCKAGYLGYMPQSDMLFPWLKVIDNILLPAKIRGGDTKKEKRKALDLLPVFGLEDYAEYLPWQLSGGLRQRVALARTYMTGSKVWLLDEPLANLDAITRNSLQDWIASIVYSLNLSVLLVTHDIEEAIKLSDRIEVMKNGIFTGHICVDKTHNENGRRDLVNSIRSML
ncbi:MAG: ATP-binding cassette domain-containing protein [Candidatus Cloacimonetes bacterium]|nr:ATP-binding cassette domain-containing protein [Candidatus Cloacimonadota bacterium]